MHKISKEKFVELYFIHVANDKIYTDVAEGKRKFIKRLKDAEELYEFYIEDNSNKSRTRPIVDTSAKFIKTPGVLGPSKRIK